MTLALSLHFSTGINRNTGPSFIHSFTHFLSLLSPVAVSQEKAGGVQAKVSLHHRQVGRLSQGHTERQVFISKNISYLIKSSNLPRVCVFGVWEEVGLPGENPPTHTHIGTTCKLLS